jgi:hypothetical protein
MFVDYCILEHKIDVYNINKFAFILMEIAELSIE